LAKVLGSFLNMTSQETGYLWVIATALLFCVGPAVGANEEAGGDPISPEHRAAMKAQFERELVTCDAGLLNDPKSVALYSERGNAHLFLGQSREAVADFEKTIALDPSQDAQNWRLGIAYYLAGEYAKSAHQFEKYHAYDGRDRENGIWKFLAQARADGIDKARAEMLKYTKFDREPFPALYQMFAGKETVEDVLAEIEKKELNGDERVLFYARYYGALDEELLGHHDKALNFMRKAVGSAKGPELGGYMWQVARLQWEQMKGK
jgi:lipoprotein NlpI